MKWEIIDELLWANCFFAETLPSLNSAHSFLFISTHWTFRSV